jgi:hypothetical protein
VLKAQSEGWKRFVPTRSGAPPRQLHRLIPNMPLPSMRQAISSRRQQPRRRALVAAGGLALDQPHWVPSSPNYLFPVRVMGALLHGKMLARCPATAPRAGGVRGIFRVRRLQVFDELMARLARARWIVYAKEPFRRVDHVLGYLGRYTHRVGMSNSRLVEVTADASLSNQARQHRPAHSHWVSSAPRSACAARSVPQDPALRPLCRRQHRARTRAMLDHVPVSPKNPKCALVATGCVPGQAACRRIGRRQASGSARRKR